MTLRQVPPEEMAELMQGGPLQPEPRDGRKILLFETLFKNPFDGWSIASRAYARAAVEAGLDVRLRDWQRPNDAVSDELEPELRGINAKLPTDWDLHVWSSPVTRYSRIDVLLNNLAEHRAGFYCVFERRHIEPELAAAFGKLNGVWVQCEMNRDVLAQAGVDNVSLIPFPFFDDDSLLQLEAPKEARTFLYIGRFEPRKSPENVIKAFFRAFKPGEARLKMKLSPFTWTLAHESLSPEGVILHELSEPDVLKNGWTVRNWRDDVEIIRGRLSKAQMIELHASSDVYVSASRGEGLDLPAYAAKLAGRRLVTTASGGPEDFAGPGDVIVPATGLVEADPRYNWGPGANYIDYDLGDLVAAMQAVRGKPVHDGRDWPMEKFRAERVGEQLRQFVEEHAVSK